MKINLKEMSAKIDGESVNGVVYVKTREIKLTKTNSKYCQGMLADGKEIVSYKVWNNYLDKFCEITENNKIINIKGKVNVYNGSVSIVITEAIPVDSGYEIKDFVTGHDKDAIEKEFYEINHRLLSDAGMNVLNIVIRDNIKDRFFVEYAGMSMHDACPSGVANHTLKMLRIAESMINNDSRVTPTMKELIILGIDFHDVGKIMEMLDGCYQKNSFVTHREFGLEILHTNKDFIVNEFDEDFYYRLASVIMGHHDKFEDPAKTIYAAIVHMIDMIDSQMTHFLDVIEGETLKEESSGEKCIQSYDGTKLYI